MYSKFDSQINCEEVSNYEPTPADWEEYHNWLQEIEASTPTSEPEEEFQLSAPKGWDKIEGDDSIGELPTDDSFDLTLEPIEYDDSIILDRWEGGFDDLRDDEYYSESQILGELYDEQGRENFDEET